MKNAKKTYNSQDNLYQTHHGHGKHIMTLFMNNPSVMHTLCFTVIIAQKYLNMRILEARPLRATDGEN